ncbi:MAG: hypothetical protein KJ066_22755 [Acidobacteria bacterium]|nr:hypothetical protein [Acidobacteriota bacterium]
MANPRQTPDPSGFTAENEIDLVLGHANPNPARDGCPSREVLATLAQRERPVEDPAYDHLTKCSPCYREVRALQQTAAGRRAAKAGSRRRLLAIAAAAVLVVGATVAWLVFSRPGDVPPGGDVGGRTAVAELAVQVDLREYALMRGGEGQADLPPISLPRGRLNLTLLLPVGSEAGQYDLQLRDAVSTTVASAIGEAQIVDFVTTLRASLETGALAPGAYELAVRRGDGDWRVFEVDVR